MGASKIWYWVASGGEDPVLELWGVRSTPSLPFLQGLLRVGVHVKVPSLGQIDSFEDWLSLIWIFETTFLCENYLYLIEILDII